MTSPRCRWLPLTLFWFFAGLPSCAPSVAQGAMTPDTLKTQVDRQMPALVTTYKQLHQHPELSHHEEKTSAFLAGELRKAGYEVTEHVGKYPDGSQAWGIVAVLKNGPGHTVLVRTDMDALPVTEATGLEYASHEVAKNAEQHDVGVMHACGHDLHMTVFLGVARALAANKAEWHGTAVLVGQPSEEMVDGARAMLADGFAERFPRPDFILDAHDSPDHAAGHVALHGGPLFAGSTSMNVVFHGIGGHASRPWAGKDPVVMASQFVVLAQDIVSRQIPANDPAVLTVGTFHAGTKSNIIPDDAALGLSLRAYSDSARVHLVDGVKNTARGVATAYGVAADRMPEVTVLSSIPPTIADGALEARMKAAAVRALSAANVDEAEPVMASEDVGVFALDGKIPLAFFALGAADPDRLAAAKHGGAPLPGLHSAQFAPVYEPAIHAGVVAMTAMALDLLSK
jgi:amidohydrolase